MATGQVLAGNKILATDVADELALVGSVRMGGRWQRVATQSLPDVALTLVSWDTEVSDSSSMWSSGTTITIPATGAGIWGITAMVTLAAGVASSALGLIGILVNGTEISRSRISDNIGSTSAIFALGAGNTITIRVYGDTAAGTTMTAQVDVWRLAP